MCSLTHRLNISGFVESVFSRLTFRVVMYLSGGRQIFRECRVEQDRLWLRSFLQSRPLASHSTRAFIMLRGILWHNFEIWTKINVPLDPGNGRLVNCSLPIDSNFERFVKCRVISPMTSTICQHFNTALLHIIHQAHKEQHIIERAPIGCSWRPREPLHCRNRTGRFF